MSAPKPKVRFGRKEAFLRSWWRLPVFGWLPGWVVYEADEVGDFENGELLAIFRRETDARAFVYESGGRLTGADVVKERT